MGQKVRIPTLGVVEFPENFTEDDIRQKISDYREKVDAEAKAKGQASDWSILERVNKEYDQKFYSLNEAQEFLLEEKKKSIRDSKISKAAEIGLSAIEGPLHFLSWDRHLEVGSQFAGAVARDIFESVSGNDYPLGSMILEGRGWDNLNEFYSSGGMKPFQFGPAARLVAGKEVIDEYQKSRPQYPADLPQGQGGLHPFYQGVSEGIETAGPIASGLVLQRAGLPMPLAYGSAMGVDAYSKTGDPVEASKAAVIGGVVPSIGNAGRNIAGKILAKLSEKAPSLASATTAQKAVESTVSLGSIGVFLEGMNWKAYRKATPEERKNMLWHSIGSLAAFFPMEAGAVVGQPSRTQMILGKKAVPLELASDINKASKGLDALLSSPEGMEAMRKMVDDYVIDSFNPDNIRIKAREKAATPPEVPIIEAKTKKTVVPMKESEAVELKEKGIDPYEMVQGELFDQPVKGKSKSSPQKLESLPSGEMTMPRKIKAPDISGDKPVSIADIRKYLSQSLDIPIRLRVGTEMSSKAGGTYYPKNETIRMKRLNELPVIAHEVGHYLHYILFPGAKDTAMSPKASDFHKKFDHELMKLGAPGKGGSSMTASKPQWYQRGEGVAEFFRYYLTGKEQALAKAPEFTKYFEKQLQHHYPEVWDIVNQARKDTAKYINQPAKAKIESMIDYGQVKKPFTPISERWESLRNKWVDQLRPIERAMENLTELPPELNPYELALNYTGGWRGKVEYSLERRQIDYNGKEIGPSFRQVMEGVESHKDFNTYIVAKRTIELGKRGKRTGIDLRDAKEVVKDLEPQYKEAAEKFYKFHHNELNILEEAGIITAKEKAKMIKDNKFYAPFHRALESEGGMARHGKGFVDLSKGVKSFKGGDQTIISPLETTIKNMYLFRDLAERNRVAKAFVNAVEGTRGGGRVAERVGFKRKQIEVKPDEVEKYLKDMGMEDAGEFSEVLPEFKIWRSYNPTSESQQIVSVWENGKQKFYQIEDADLYRALKMQDSTHASLLGSFWLKGTLTMPTRVLRAGATLTPEFFARNPFRDQVAAGIYSKYGYVPFVDGFKGMLSVLGKDKVYWDWVKAGGRYADFLAGDRKDITKKLSDFSNEPQVMEAMKKWGNPLTTLQKISEVMEISTRVGEFRRAKERGASDVEAANAAKDITLNFSKGGQYGKAYNKLSAFYNAKVQDLNKFALEQKKNPIETNMKAMLYVTTPSLAVWWLGKDDKEIQNLPEWRKNLFWNVNLKPLAEQAGMKMDDDFVFSIPKPFLLGTLYGTSVEKALDYVYKDDPRAVEKFFEDLERHNPLPVHPHKIPFTSGIKEKLGVHFSDDEFTNWDVLPTGLKVWSELATNYDTFRRRSIENLGVRNLPKELRMGPQTSEVARMLGEVTGVSPLNLDHFTRGIFAGLGKHGVDALDYALIRAGLVDVPEPPKKKWRELPFIKAFSRSPYAGNKQIEQFYKGAEKAEQTISAIKQIGPHLGTAQQRNYFNKNKKRIIFYSTPVRGKTMLSFIQKGKKELGEISDSMMLVQKSRELSPEEKTRRLIKLSKDRNDLAEKLVLLLYPPDYEKIK